MNTSTQKPTTGRLLHILEDGRKIELAKDLPFCELQNLKKYYICRGLKKENLRLTY
ncbi:MAG: hypothetical protein LBL58_13910 [Tannerellaceae bacterium]|jgi:hypothetical protein|nr:hypothetical protein [Tannerellaceae bacterium]